MFEKLDPLPAMAAELPALNADISHPDGFCVVEVTDSAALGI